MFEIKKYLDEKGYSDEQRRYFDEFNLKAYLHESEKQLIIEANNAYILSAELYADLLQYFKDKFPELYVELEVKAKNGEDLNIVDASNYLSMFYASLGSDMFSYNAVILDNPLTRGYTVSFNSEADFKDEEYIFDDIKEWYKRIGYTGKLSFGVRENSEFIEEKIEALPETNYSKPKKEENKKYHRKSLKQYKEESIANLAAQENSEVFYQFVCVKGKIFKVDERKNRNKKLIQDIYVVDENNEFAIMASVIEGRSFAKEDLEENKIGRYVRMYGNYQYNNFKNKCEFQPTSIEYLDKKDKLVDSYPDKRVELHAHTNMSELDGVCSASEIVRAAYEMGHKAVAITDHNVVQAFPIAQDEAKKIEKSGGNIKVLYGCEFNMVDPDLNVVYNPKDLSLSDSEYVVFDLETTGLSSRYDRVIEFGAVLMLRGNIVESKDFFINPECKISESIKELTNISQSDVDKARNFAECKDEILDFLKGRILVAHNASFDIGFLNSELKRLGEKELDNTVIDTLDLARSIFKDRRTYRLGNIARQYRINYDEEDAHRADYDAEVLAKVFNLMLAELRGKGINDVLSLAKMHDDNDFIKKNANHVTVLCKNHDGLKDLFKLVSIAHTENLAVFSKPNSSEYMAEPRLFRETLQSKRENLIIGSACQNGEVFKVASTGSQEELAKAISFYDYIEVQPLDNYRNLVVDRDNYSWDDIRQFIKDIISEAKKQDKLIVATGDIHYVSKQEKTFRDININTIGIGGVHHPLYVFNKHKRAEQITPDQHFFSTNEMIDCFSWLEDKDLVEEIVIKNTNYIAQQCAVLYPIHKDLYTPNIEGSEEKFIELVYQNAKEKYGDPLPEEIEKRLKREMDSIVGQGYSVIYYVSHLLVKKSNDEGYLVGSRGSVGSSLVATMAKITEVNPMAPHYLCPKCHHLEWADTKIYPSGYDLPDKQCPVCNSKMKGDGQNIPFETFLGFHGDKVPDIDLNFSSDYQAKAHLFLREIFGEDHVFRAGTISTVADKTAFGYARKYCEEKGINANHATLTYLASGCIDVKRTTGQHPGGIIVIPEYMDVYDFTPVQYPANDLDTTWKTTHFDFHKIHDNVLKFDILGHVDPTAMRQLQNISGIDPKTIPMNDEKVMSIFSSPKALGIEYKEYNEKTGACGLPEFGTRFVRGILVETQPKNFSDLVIISGLSHGTDVWNDNAQKLISDGTITELRDVIGCRDDIMVALMAYGLPPEDSFKIMESVRKGKGLSQQQEELMRENKVPDWYIDSCKKIQYMFPKAHAVAYVMMAVRIAWFKVYYPAYYYVSFFSLRCDAYELKTMIADTKTIKQRMDELLALMDKKQASKKEEDIYDTLEICYEMTARGYHLSNIDLLRSDATNFLVNPDNEHEIIPPFVVLDGLGANVAESIVEARNNRAFSSKEDLMKRTQLSKTLMKQLTELGVLDDLGDSEQVSLF